jgi:hypothetical protein
MGEKVVRKPKELGLYLTVKAGRAPPLPFCAADADGHATTFSMDALYGAALAEVALRRGLAAAEAAAILRKLADRIERYGGELLTLTRGNDGRFSRFGEPELTMLQGDDGAGDDPGAAPPQAPPRRPPRRPQ